MTDKNGNIVDLDGKKVFPRDALNSDGDFPKIFPFTKFNPDTVTGNFDREPSTGAPILSTTTVDGKPLLTDRDKRPVNPAGYLINDKNGDVVDEKGNRVIPKGMLDGPDGQLPPILRGG